MVTASEISNLSYKGFTSVTFFLVMMGYITGTALLVFGYIDAHVWETGILGLVSGYIVRDAVSKISEAYWTKRINEPDVTPVIPTP